jgi:hypothetical protein
MRAAALQRADPARFAALQRQQAATRMRAAALQQAQLAAGIVRYPIPYGVLTGAALQRQQAVARMQAAARGESSAARKEMRKRLIRVQQERMRRAKKG